MNAHGKDCDDMRSKCHIANSDVATNTNKQQGQQTTDEDNKQQEVGQLQ